MGCGLADQRVWECYPVDLLYLPGLKKKLYFLELFFKEYFYVHSEIEGKAQTFPSHSMPPAPPAAWGMLRSLALH